MPVLKYENLTHVELSGLPRDKTVVFMAAGPLEQHGPHLPLGTDALTAEYFGGRVAEKLQQTRSDWTIVLFPTIFAGSDTLTYTGSVEIKPHILRALLYDCCKQLAKDGFRNIVLFGTHGGPRHMVVLEEVASKMRWRHRARVVSASAAILYDILSGGFADKLADRMAKRGQALSADERGGLKNDFHGGLLETSVMMVAKPALVKESYKTLQPAIVDGLWKLRRSSGKKTGAGLGHLGSPALARPEIGEAAVEVLVDDVSPLLERFLDGDDVFSKFRSKFYYIPFFRTDFKIIIAFMAMALAFTFAIHTITRFMTEMYK